MKQVTDAMVNTGLRDAGYLYVNIGVQASLRVLFHSMRSILSSLTSYADDCWMEKRGEDGR